jgi:hypothetical protein
VLVPCQVNKGYVGTFHMSDVGQMSIAMQRLVARHSNIIGYHGIG